jgi:GTPase SAR1 family protein
MNKLFSKVTGHKKTTENEDHAAANANPAVSNVVNIVMVGDEAVGKSSIINCYAFDTFSDEYVPSAFD